jgi:hypothetical protein
MLTKKFAKVNGPMPRDIMFFINHPFSNFYMGHEFDDDVYEFEAALTTKENWKDSQTLSALFFEHTQKLLDSGCCLVWMEYEPTILVPLFQMGEDMRKNYGIIFQFFAFFHNDEETELMFRNHPQKNFMELREEWRSCLASFPQIHITEHRLEFPVSIELADRLYREYRPVEGV